MTFLTRIALGNPGTGAALYPAKGKVLSARPWFVGPFGGLASPRNPTTGSHKQPSNGTPLIVDQCLPNDVGVISE
jgi:hypothetical protein